MSASLTEGTDMNQIEKVARVGMALCQNALGGKQCPCAESGVFKCADEYPGQQAKAAIAAMQPAPQKPVAWMYERGHARHLHKTRLRDGGLHYYGDGWTERALGIIPTPPAGGSDAE